jgi:hypothetical protein
MSISRRTISSSRPSLSSGTSRTTSSSSLLIHPVLTYFSSVLGNDRDLSKITIVCFDKKLPGSQIIFNFAADTCGVFFKCRLTKINNYIRNTELYHTISPYGDIPHLLYILVTSILKQNTPIKTKKTLGITLTKINTSGNIVASLNNSVDYVIDKTERGADSNNECPVCLSKFENVEKITLKCYHRICRDCLFNSVDNNLYTCPMCRKPFFPVSNPSSLPSVNAVDTLDGFDVEMN